MAEALTVFLNRELLGTLTLEGKEDRYGLEYVPSWIQSQGYAISPHLRIGECESERVKRFLSNLLPEGKWLEELSVDNQISKNNIFGLIALIGTETTGALTFQYETANQGPRETDFREVSTEELTERIAQRQQVSIARWDGKTRLSVAGVQEKLPVMIRPDGVMGFGEGELASTHILKFGKRPDMHMMVNEFICMELARSVKLPVAKVSLKRLGEPVLMVDRFDRLWKNGKVERLHLIDGCQMLDMPPTYKYERPYGKSGEGARIRTGASLPRLFESSKNCRVPAMAKRDLLNWTLFQLLIGNSDAHGKNISFFVSRSGIDVAPSYDLLNIDVYGDEFDFDLAMAIGDEFVIEEILPYQLAEFCIECKLPQRQVATSLENLCTAVPGNLDALPMDDIESGSEMDFAQELLELIKKNAKRFLEMSRELPHLKF
ncbi:MAG: HipA domain-containing protein [bacterium]|nr:HipA domain-containing protein [bacterium]MDT8365857.1 HipA domain-containing protein [bacterium]